MDNTVENPEADQHMTIVMATPRIEIDETQDTFEARMMCSSFTFSNRIQIVTSVVNRDSRAPIGWCVESKMLTFFEEIFLR